MFSWYVAHVFSNVFEIVPVAPIITGITFVFTYYYSYYHYYHHFCYHLYAGYLQLCTWNKPCLYSIQCCSCSVFTVCATCKVISLVKYVLHSYISTSVVFVQCLIWLFFVVPWFRVFPVRCWGIVLSDFEMLPVAPVITGITFAFRFRMRWISVMKSLYFKIFSAYFFITFLSPVIATSINMHVPCSLSRIMISGLLLGVVLSVHPCWLRNMVSLGLLYRALWYNYVMLINKMHLTFRWPCIIINSYNKTN